MHLTRGEGIMSRQFLRYGTHKGQLDGVRKGESGVRPERLGCVALGAGCTTMSQCST